jgi:hypothetical protein
MALGCPCRRLRRNRRSDNVLMKSFNKAANGGRPGSGDDSPEVGCLTLIYLAQIHSCIEPKVCWEQPMGTHYL